MNWIKKNRDEDSVWMDAICLAEAAWWGRGKKLYNGWDHGIYAWRQLCTDAAPWLHSAWEKAQELSGGEDTVCFDSEFCEAIGSKLLEANSDQFHPYMLQLWVEELYSGAEQRLRDLCANPNSSSDDIREAIGRFLEECK
jgi:hypothetical protein